MKPKPPAKEAKKPYLVDNFTARSYIDDLTKELKGAKISDTEVLVDPMSEENLVEQELLVGRFYLKKKAWLAAVERFRGALAEYPAYAHRDQIYLAMGEAYLRIGDPEQAKNHALAAYRWAWADGEPYVNRYELNKTRALLDELGVEAPDLPPYDPAREEKLPWEDEVVAAINKLRAENEAKKAAD